MFLLGNVRFIEFVAAAYIAHLPRSIRIMAAMIADRAVMTGCRTANQPWKSEPAAEIGASAGGCRVL